MCSISENWLALSPARSIQFRLGMMGMPSRMLVQFNDLKVFNTRFYNRSNYATGVIVE